MLKLWDYVTVLVLGVAFYGVYFLYQRGFDIYFLALALVVAAMGAVALISQNHAEDSKERVVAKVAKPNAEY
ncbi:MAG: hypothetical protein UH963_14305 [Agathobacter sp.]|nr:hypothetical protein [Agathobacter sp.]